jgi:hypothetical protein
MKKLLLNCFIALFVAFAVSSCSDDEAGNSGSFTFDGTTYKISKAFVRLEDSYTSGDDTWYEWQILFTSKGIKFDSDEDDFVGTGDAMVIYVYVANDDGFLPEGTYQYNQETAYCDGIYIDFNAATGDGDEFGLDDPVITVTISKSGSTYTIKITGGDLEGKFKGKVTEYEYSSPA